MKKCTRLTAVYQQWTHSTSQNLLTKSPKKKNFQTAQSLKCITLTVWNNDLFVFVFKRFHVHYIYLIISLVFYLTKERIRPQIGTIIIPGTYLIPFLCSLQRPQFWVFSNKEILSLSRMTVFIFKQSLSGIETFSHILRDTVSPINSMICIDTSFKTCYACILFYYCMGINYQNGDFCY